MSKIEVLAAPKTVPTTRAAARQSDAGRVAGLLNRFLRGHRNVFVLAFLMLALESGTTVAAKYPLAYLIDYISGSKPGLDSTLSLPVLVSERIDTVGWLTLALIVIALLNSITDSLSEIYLARGGRLLGFKLRSALYSHLQKLSLAFYSRQRTGDLLTRVTGDVTALEDFAINSLKDIASSIFLLSLTLVALLLASWQVALVALVMVPPLALISNYFSERIKAASKRQRAREGELASAAQEMLTSIRVIQTYSRGGYEQKRFADQSLNAMNVALEAARLQAWFSGIINVLQAVVIAAVVWVGIWLIDGGGITIGALVFFIGLIQDMFKPTKRIIKEWNAVGKIFASAERIGDLLDRKPAVEDAPDAVEMPTPRGKIEYRHVSFAYQPDVEDIESGKAEKDPRLALNDLSFNIAPGEVVALVGGSGAGKTTILQLLPRLYDPHVGGVLVDGHDIREYTLDSLRSHIGMVLQDTILFTGTVADNIAYGRSEGGDAPTHDDIVEAATQANAHDFITAMPEGYDTHLSERASNLSGGQRQRIAIARAFIRNAPILLLDEPTTGLDAESADLVLQALRTLMQGKTTIIISHDLNLIRHADKIMVVKDGQIEQTGTHEELLKEEGLYANLYHKQFGQAGPDREPSPSVTAIVAPPAPLRLRELDDELAFAPEEDGEQISDAAFETMLLRALPRPVARGAFETILQAVALPHSPYVEPDGDGTADEPEPQPQPEPQAAPAPEPDAKPEPEPLAAPEPEPEPVMQQEPEQAHDKAIFRTSVMRVLPPPGARKPGPEGNPPEGER
jgi:ABC-type multidrug transport system fused ATPase/permease subunit